MSTIVHHQCSAPYVFNVEIGPRFESFADTLQSLMRACTDRQVTKWSDIFNCCGCTEYGNDEFGYGQESGTVCTAIVETAGTLKRKVDRNRGWSSGRGDNNCSIIVITRTRCAGITRTAVTLECGLHGVPGQETTTQDVHNIVMIDFLLR